MALSVDTDMYADMPLPGWLVSVSLPLSDDMRERMFESV